MLQDIKVAVRALLRQPSYLIPAVLALALGMSSNIVMFSLINQVILRALPYPESERLMIIFGSSPAQGIGRGVLSVADFIDIKANTKSFSSLAAYFSFRCTLPLSSDKDTAEAVPCGYTTAGFFTVFRTIPLAGRLFVDGDDDAGKPPSAVLTEGLWRRKYGASADVIGRVLNIAGKPYTIVGVAPASFQFPRDVELWVSIPLDPQPARTPFYLRTLARLKPGATVAQAKAELSVLSRQIEIAYPAVYSNLSLPAQPLQEAIVGDVRLTLWLLQGVAAVVLLIALVNVANLSLARGLAKGREIALRTCLGSGYGRIVRLLLTESALVALMGAALGLTLWWAAIKYLRILNPRTLPRLAEISTDLSSVVFAVILAVVCAMVFGLYPALQAVRPNLTESLKSGARTSTGRATNRRQGVLVVIEIAMAFMLVMAGVLLARSFVALSQVDLGYTAPPGDLLTMQIYPSGKKFTKERRVQFYRQLLGRLSQLPGVQGVAISASLPDLITYSSGFEVEGSVLAKPGEMPDVIVPTSSPDYFKTLGIPLVGGRYFTDADDASGQPVVIVSEMLAKRYFPNQDAVGKRIRESVSDEGRPGPGPYLRIVGVVGNVRYRGRAQDFEPVFYTSAYQAVTPYFNYLALRASNPARLVNAVKAEVRAIDRTVTVSKISTMDQILSESVAQPKLRTLLGGLFGGFALVLAVIGTYGVISYSVGSRTHEIGIKMALGARAGTILRDILRNALTLAAAGTVAGVLGALTLSRFLKSLLFGVSVSDPLTYLFVAIIMLTVAVIAALIPAMRATGISPSTALRNE